MNPFSRATVAVAIASAACIGSAQVKWSGSFDQAMAASKASGKLVMLDFYTDW